MNQTKFPTSKHKLWQSH